MVNVNPGKSTWFLKITYCLLFEFGKSSEPTLYFWVLCSREFSALPSIDPTRWAPSSYSLLNGVNKNPIFTWHILGDRLRLALFP